MKIGVLALQGAFAEHIATLEKLKTEAIPVRLPHQLEGFGRVNHPRRGKHHHHQLMVHYKLKNKIIELAKQGFPIFGTCAGMIVLAGELSSAGGVKPTGVMDIKVNRNAFGRQVESFESEISIPAIGEKANNRSFHQSAANRIGRQRSRSFSTIKRRHDRSRATGQSAGLLFSPGVNRRYQIPSIFS